MSGELQSNKLDTVSSLAVGIAHDFNNILSLLDGYARMANIRIGEGDIEGGQKYLERINIAVQRGTNLTRKLLLFSDRKVSGDKVIEIGQSLSNLNSFYLSKLNPSISLLVHSLDDAQIKCPPDLFMDMLVGVLDNACDAMPDGGQITVETRKCTQAMLPEDMPEQYESSNKNYILLTIKDTGSGMPQEVIDKAIEPFFSTKNDTKSSGFGLAVAYGLASQMEAYFALDSQEGYGTTVSFYIPIYSDVVSHEDVKGPGDFTFEGRTILIADDEEELLEILGSELESLGFNVLSANDGNDALEVQDGYDGDIDILLTDIVMPELNGIRLAKLMNAVRPDTLIIFMSGYPAGSKLEDIDLPAEANILAKPLNYDALPDLLSQTLKNNREVADYGLLNQGDAVWQF